ncbi:RagB/SusD family nutrient uptake outer membrane protein [Reichenbachiella agarivorans]|uniref:RagB/SusD family nutrient uptake outer membrane protein n=1 Tax=Reichenbachiella agarivorans TaxID=2979464 RepID=A0ABY6CNH2_9BACT|nr:RagB/SusD family nutrient uptake outer membrane protein [Reichenbachiella agarivorans]UXP32056.1 RagB/SusD family nutrient uptake outer membrane protein [Reichenbachiella agarivorans]
MKLKIIYIYLAIMVGIFSIPACEDYLDVSPDLGLDDEEVYSNYETFQGVIAHAYWTLHNYAYDPHDWDSEIGTLSDEAQHLSTNSKPIANVANQGLWQDFDWIEFGFDYNWSEGDPERKLRKQPAGEAVVGIRMVNLALENLDKLENFPDLANFTPEEMKRHLEGEARLIRAWHYFQIIQRYGGIFFMNRSFESTDLVDSTRRSYQECTDWLISDLDKAAELLPKNWPVNFEGRATVTTAKAIKSMALLYAASPNMNMFDGGANAYNLTRAQEAAEAALETLAAAENSAYYRMLPLAEYKQNWCSATSGISYEALWGPPQSNANAPTATSAGNGWYNPHWDGGWAVWSGPTQNAVDKFETVNGLAIEDDPVYNPQDPFINRDPRLDMFVYKNGDNMYISSPSNKPATLEAWNGGYHDLQAKTVGLWTGYLHRKHRWDGANNVDNVAGVKRIFPLIRYAQVYLDFAEAANEAVGPTTAISAGGKTMTAVQALNVVRSRVGMPDVDPMYTGSKEALRERIRNERFVELYQEMHRWHDLRRWRIADEVLKEIYRADILKSGSTIIYNKEEIEGARVFEERHYWYPFPNSEMRQVENFTQNPGW